MSELAREKNPSIGDFKLPKCERCGMCCILGVCYAGDEDEFGICVHLTVHEDMTTSCDIAHLLDFIGTGCFIRGNTALFEAAKEVRALDEIKRMTYERRKADDQDLQQV